MSISRLADSLLIDAGLPKLIHLIGRKFVGCRLAGDKNDSRYNRFIAGTIVGLSFDNGPHRITLYVSTPPGPFQCEELHFHKGDWFMHIGGRPGFTEPKDEKCVVEFL